jgi:transposase
MSVYVGIDVHRKRSQVAVIDQVGKVLVNRNVPNGVEPILGVIGGLPPGTPTAFEAAFGWGWLVQLLEDYGFEPHLVHPLQCKAIASARLKNDPLTELTAAVDQVSGRAGGLVANVARHDHRRRCAAGLVPAGGAVARVA